MNIFEAIFLGIVQGLTEFLPISSTGHLTVAGKLMNLIDPAHPDRWTAFIAVIQLGTMLAVIVYFWKDLLNITIRFLSDNIFTPKKFSSQSFDSKLGWYIIIGTIPVVVIGLGFKDIIEGALTKSLYVVSISLIVLGIILAFAEKAGTFKRDIKEITFKDGLIIGFAQCLALIPGSSRSGTTITAGLFIGLKRETAARFSFLLSVPAVLGSGLYQLYKSLEYIDTSGLSSMIIATAASAVSGYLAIEFLLRFLRSNSTFVFVFYRIAIGLAILLLIWTGIINP